MRVRSLGAGDRGPPRVLREERLARRLGYSLQPGSETVAW